MRDFLGLCLQKDPQCRATVSKLLQHKWMHKSIKQIKKQHEILMKNNSNDQYNNELKVILDNVADISLERQTQNDIFYKNQEYENFCRMESENEELAREEMSEADHEMHMFLILEQEAFKKAQRRKSRLDKEAALAQEAAQREEEELERKREAEECSFLENEDSASQLVNDEAYCSDHLTSEGELLKQSDVIGAWNSRYFYLEKTLITYYLSVNDSSERGRFLISPTTTVELAPTNQSIVEISNNDSPNWKLRLSCESSMSDSNTWLCRFQKSINYTKSRQRLHIERRLSLLEKRIRHMGWVRKVSEYMGQWNSRYVTIWKGVLTYFDQKEKFGSTRFRGQYEFSAATSVTLVPYDKDTDMIRVDDVVQQWSITFTGDADKNDNPRLSTTEYWISVIRAHIALVS